MEITLHSGQQEVLNSAARFIGVSSGVQGGKTTVGAIWLLREIWKAHESGKHGDWLITAPTLDIIRASTLKEFRPLFPKDWGVWKEAQKQFELKFGGRIFVRTADDPNHIEGMTLLGAWMDEAGQMKDEIWPIIQARTAIWSKDGYGRVLMTSTPYEPNWYYRDVYRKVGQDAAIDMITWPSYMNPRFPKEEYDRAKATMAKALFERRYEGKFTRLEGLVYDCFDVDLHVIEPFDIPDTWIKFAGLDFGQSVATACVAIAEDPIDHKFYVYGEFYRRGILLRELAHFLNLHSFRYVQADSQGAQNIAELQRYYGCKAIHQADKRVMVGIERVTQLLREGRLFFFAKRTEHTISEIIDYQWKKQDPNRAGAKDEPVKKNDHAMDALRYAFNVDKTAGSVYPAATEGRRSLRSKVRSRMARMQNDTDFYTGY